KEAPISGSYCLAKPSKTPLQGVSSSWFAPTIWHLLEHIYKGKFAHFFHLFLTKHPYPTT
ncbi:MAG: hypothetical protein BRC44_01380, partial [Cyanobacteria bacterium QS_4_48_99]